MKKTQKTILGLTILLIAAGSIEVSAASLVAFPLASTFGSFSIPILIASVAFIVWVVVHFAQTMKGDADADQEHDVMLDHEYDGIRELDNKLPPWWLALFYISIIFGASYLLHYHVIGSGPLPAEEYEIEMAFAKAQLEKRLANMNVIDEFNVTRLTDEESLAAGEEIYIKLCLVCHGANGEGGVGPNMTDEYWIHGGDIKDLFRTIKYGVPEKGMISWQNQFTPEQMQQSASFMLTFQGTNPPNQKEAQGELWVPETETQVDTTTAGENE
jgi:cytochrome c oxidase cbb3-type subunit 3